MMTRQMLSTVSSGRWPVWRSTKARIIAASRAGRKAEPPPWRCLIAISLSMIWPRSINRACIAASSRSISTRSPLSSSAAASVTASIRSGVHRFEEIGVGLGLAQLAEQEFDRVDRAHRVEDAAQHVHLLEDVGRHQQLFLAG